MLEGLSHSPIASRAQLVLTARGATAKSRNRPIRLLNEIDCRRGANASPNTVTSSELERSARPFCNLATTGDMALAGGVLEASMGVLRKARGQRSCVFRWKCGHSAQPHRANEFCLNDVQRLGGTRTAACRCAV